MDEVDRIVASWAREAPTVDTTPMRVFSRVSRLARHLDRARHDVFAARGLEVWEFDVLAALRRSGAPYELSPGALIKETLSTSGTMTNRVDRLTDRGLVDRHRDPHDRRGVRVRLTEAGRDLADGALADLVDVEAGLLRGLDSDEIAATAHLLARLLEPFEGND